MPLSLKPWSIDGNVHPAIEGRRALAEILGVDLTTSFSGGVPTGTQGVDFGAGAGLGPTPGHGVTYATDLKVTQNGTPNMSVLIAAGGAYVRGTQAASQGCYSIFNDASTNVSIGSADPSNPRNDLVIAQVRDGNYSGIDFDARFAVIQGTPAASPSDPSTAAFPNALVLARVRVNAGATSITNANITDLRTGTGLWFVGRGRAGRIIRSASSATTTTTPIYPDTVTWIAAAHRRYSIRAVGNVTSGGSGDLVSLGIADNSGVILTQNYIGITAGGASYFGYVEVERTGLSAGSQSHKSVIYRAGGSGNTQIAAGATAQFILAVEDMGGLLA